MKLRLIFYTGIILFLMASCSEKEQEIESDIAPQNITTEKPITDYAPKVALNDCIHNALYYLDNTEINTYDSIDTHYFHEVLGYTNKNALDLEKKLQISKHSILIDTLNNLGAICKDQIEEEIENLRYELYTFDKEVIGYVFIHTYAIKQDTLSAIIVMSKNCSSSQAIPVNAIKDIDPSDYSYQVQQIESKI